MDTITTQLKASIQLESVKNIAEAKIKLYEKFIDTLMQHFEGQFDNDESCFSYAECEEYVMIARTMEDLGKRKHTYAKRVTEYLQKLPY